MTDRAELAALRDRFMAFRLERAVSRLASPISLMNTGAHPDDEHSALLAWLRFGRGLAVSTLSSTRGQGGQNRIGPERGDLLGLIRSREMEHAARVLDADHIWLDRGPGDPLTDFGFSKSGEDTLRRWGGEAAVVNRMVRVYRTHRPDIILPTFLDVPGQHGHHRAMTHAALAAVGLAADPDYLTDDLPPWTVAKVYLPAWSGGGATYDDEVPPPLATVTVKPSAAEPWTGADWGLIGEASRLCHATQDMGDPDARRPAAWPLHRVGGVAERDLLDGLPLGFADLTDAPDSLRDVDAALADAQTLRREDLLVALVQADAALADARANASAEFQSAHWHRLARLKLALDRAVLLAADALPRRLVGSAASFTAGASVAVMADPPLAPGSKMTLTATDGFLTELGVAAVTLRATDAARPADGFAPSHSSLGGNGRFFGVVSATIHTRIFRAPVDFDSAPVFLPGTLMEPIPPLIHRRGAVGSERKLDLPPDAALSLPEGVMLNSGLLSLAGDLAEGRYRMPVTRKGAPATTLRRGLLVSGEQVELIEPLVVDLLSLDLQLPTARIGYLPGTENLTLILQAAGLKVTPLDALPPAAELARLDSILIGSVGFGRYPALAEQLPQLRDWVTAGGNLVTFYQRPDQGWPVDGLGLDRLRVGTPSLRWRVTDPTAPVTILAPDAAVLHQPNRITTQDFDGWTKERGLYFAASWGDGYQPLLAMADPDEQPLSGSLLVGRFGAGQHVHCCLNLPHQIEALTPGAFRLLANLLQPVR